MEALATTTTLDIEDRALKILFDTFGSVLSLEDITSAFCKAGRDANLACLLLSAMPTSPSPEIANIVNDLVKSETPSKSSDANGFCKSSYAIDEKTSRLKNNSAFRGTAGKEYVWRVKAGQDGNLVGEITSGAPKIPSADTNTAHISKDCLKSEANSVKSTNVNAFNSDSCYANKNDEPKESKMENVLGSKVFASAVGMKDYVWRVKVGGDANLEGEVLRGTPTNPSSDVAHASNGWVKRESSLQSYGEKGFDDSCHAKNNTNNNSECRVNLCRVWEDPNVPTSKVTCSDKPPNTFYRKNIVDGFKPESCHLNNNDNSKPSRLKGNPISADTFSSFPRKNSVWRPRKAQDANLNDELLCRIQTGPPDNTAYVSNGGAKCQTSPKAFDGNGSSKSYFANRNDDCQTSRLTRNPVSRGNALGVVGKDSVWRVRTKETPNEMKPVKVEVDKNLRSEHSSSESLLEGNADSRVNKDFEDFLLNMLGPGFQLEKGAILEVLGNCRYDMKKSLDVILDLAAATLDTRNGFHEGPKTLSSQNQGQKLAASGSRAMSCNGILSRQSTEKHEMQKDVLTPSFRISDKLDSIEEDIGDKRHAKTTSANLVDARDAAEDESYRILRKTVQEYRDTTKEYYKAAAEAFASGDRARASILLEKGQFFFSKAREADEESAEKIFEISSRDGEMQNDMCLDLQHHRPKEAVHLVKFHLHSLSGIVSIGNLKIIVGIGEQDVEKRKRLVIKLLEKEGIDWIEDKNSGTISIRLDQINPKRLSFANK